MSASRNNLIPLALLAFLALPSLACAQEAGPDQPAKEIVPEDLLDKNIGGEYTPPAPIKLAPGASAVERGVGGVQTQDLAPVSPETLGTLDESQGGLPISMWKGTPRELLVTYLPKLPASPGARTPFGMQRRLLLSSAEVPQGEPGLGEQATAALLIRRIERLYAMGDWEDGRKLLALVPEKLQAETLVRYDVEALFLDHQDKEACQRADPYLTKGEDRFWTKAAVVCSFLGNDKAHAGLALDMMREEQTNDPFFFAQAESMLGLKTKKFPPLDESKPLNLVLLRLAGKPLPDGTVEKLSSPASLRAIAKWTEFSGENRLTAARKAEMAGALPASELRSMYEAVDFTEQELAGAADAAGKDKGPRPRALLYRAAKAQSEPAKRAEFIAKGLGLAGNGNELLAAMRLYAPLVQDLPAGSELGWFAPTAMRVLLAAGDIDKAKAWSDVARPKPDQGEVVNKGADVLLLPLLRLMNLSPALELPHLQNWREAQKDAPPERAAMLFGLLEALGDKVPPEMWLAETNAKPDNASVPPAIWHGLKDAQQDGSAGQAALFSLLALGDSGPGGASPLVVQEVVRTLKAAGLETEARSLALEAAVAAGI